MNQANKTVTYYLIRLIICLLPSLGYTQSALDEGITQQQDWIKTAQGSQKTIDSLAQQSGELLEKYRTVLHKTADLEAYNVQLETLIKKQSEMINGLAQQMDNIAQIRRDLVPFMLRMLTTLEQFIDLDMPFLVAERQQRITALKDLMNRPDADLPEKYRRIMEAYQIELEYARTIESYTDTIQIDDDSQTVNILRIGRLILLYQSLDGLSSGRWSALDRQWHPLPDRYRNAIATGIKIAKKQAPPDLISLPVPTPAAYQ